MRTGAIRHPENDSIIIRRGWQIDALSSIERQRGTKKDDLAEVGAELLTVFEFHYNNRMSNRILRKEMERFLYKRPTSIYPLGDWMPYTTIYLMELLLGGRGKNVIMKAVDLVEQTGFISTNVPEDITAAIAKKCTWIKLEPAIINQWIDANCEKTWASDWVRPYVPVIVAEVKTIEPVDSDAEISPAQEFELQLDQICEFHRHIHGKNPSYLYKGPRRNKIKARRKEGRTMGQCAQAIIGDRLSEWHNGTDPTNTKRTIYDDPELIFRDVVKFDMFIGHAEDNGVTEGIALVEFECLFKGQTSRYAKPTLKLAPIAPEGQQTYVSPLSDEERKRYRDFARAMGAFFVTNTPIAELIEFTKTNASVAKFNTGITDLLALQSTLTSAVKVYRPTGVSKQIEEHIIRFATVFVRMQQANSHKENHE